MAVAKFRQNFIGGHVMRPFSFRIDTDHAPAPRRSARYWLVNDHA